MSTHYETQQYGYESDDSVAKHSSGLGSLITSISSRQDLEFLYYSLKSLFPDRLLRLNNQKQNDSDSNDENVVSSYRNQLPRAEVKKVLINQLFRKQKLPHDCKDDTQNVEVKPKLRQQRPDRLPLHQQNKPMKSLLSKYQFNPTQQHKNFTPVHQIPASKVSNTMVNFAQNMINNPEENAEMAEDYVQDYSHSTQSSQSNTQLDNLQLNSFQLVNPQASKSKNEQQSSSMGLNGNQSAAVLPKSPEQNNQQYKCDPENVPFVINRYLHVTTRFVILSLITILILSFVFQVKQDLSFKMQTENDLLMQEIAQCQSDYYDNKCEPGHRVRALEDFCREKETCMLRDPQLVNKNTKIMVKLLAEIINDFFEPLSYKTMAFLIFSFLGLVMFSECLGKRSLRNGKEKEYSKKKL
eukprot:403372207